MILDGVQITPISSVSDNAPYGVNCVIDMPNRGLREKSDRVLTVRTVWLIADANIPPRLVSAYQRDRQVAGRNRGQRLRRPQDDDRR